MKYKLPKLIHDQANKSCNVELKLVTSRTNCELLGYIRDSHKLVDSEIYETKYVKYVSK